MCDTFLLSWDVILIFTVLYSHFFILGFMLTGVYDCAL